MPKETKEELVSVFARLKMNKTKRIKLMKFYKINEVAKGVYNDGFFDGLNIAYKYHSNKAVDGRIWKLQRKIKSLENEIKILKKNPSVKSIENRNQRHKGQIKRLNEAIDFWRNRCERLAKTPKELESKTNMG